MTFKQGKSGNPSGRPPGIVDKRTKLRNLLDPHVDTIIEKLIERAIAGDPTALRLCIERIMPRVKPDQSITFELPEGRIDSGDNMMKIANSVTEAVASGEMTIDEAEKFTAFLRHQRLILQQAENTIKDEKWKKERGY